MFYSLFYSYGDVRWKDEMLQTAQYSRIRILLYIIAYLQYVASSCQPAHTGFGKHNQDLLLSKALTSLHTHSHTCINV